MKFGIFLLTAALWVSGPASAQTVSAAKDGAVYETFAQRVCKLMAAPWVGEVVMESMIGCQWKLTDANGQPVPDETLTATAAFNTDDKAYLYMYGYIFGGYAEAVGSSNGSARFELLDTCQKMLSAGQYQLPSSFQYYKDDGKAPPVSDAYFHCGTVMVKLTATGRKSVEQIVPLAKAMEAIVH